MDLALNNNFSVLAYEDLLLIDGGFDVNGFFSGAAIAVTGVGMVIGGAVTAPITAPVAVAIGTGYVLAGIGGFLMGYNS